MKLLCANALALLFLSACDGSKPTDGDEPGLQGGNNDSEAELDDDVLAAPDVMQLELNAQPGTLNFSWLPVEDTTEYTLWSADARNGESEVVVAVPGTTTSVDVPINAMAFDWAHTRFSVQACDSLFRCVSSHSVDPRSAIPEMLQQVQQANPSIADKFGQDVALTSNGQMFVVSHPGESMGHLYSNFNNQHAHMAEVPLERSSEDELQVLLTDINATGDTMVFASWSAEEQLRIQVFDLAGPTWTQSETLSPTLPTGSFNLWRASTMQMQLAEDGNSLIVSVQGLDQENQLVDDAVLYFSRTGFSWSEAESLPTISGSTRLPALSASANLEMVHLLGKTTEGEIAVHRMQRTTDGTWNQVMVPDLPSLPAAQDNLVSTAADGNSFVVASWEISSTVGRSPVLWALSCVEPECTQTTIDSSLRLPPTKISDALLRLSTNGQLNRVLLGWQANTEGAISVLNYENRQWVETLALPNDTPLVTGRPFVSDVAISSDGETGLVSSIQTMPFQNPEKLGNVLILD